MTAHATASTARTTLRLVKGLLLGGTLALGFFGISAQADAQQTYCQINGHGASGCSMGGNSTGYCWSNASSPTGYVCKEDEPPKDALEILEPVEPEEDPYGEEADLYDQLELEEFGF